MFNIKINIMKKLSVLFSFLVFIGTIGLYSQVDKKEIKECKEFGKKRAKQLEKEANPWVSDAGLLEDLYEKSCTLRKEVDKKGNNIYAWAEGRADGMDFAQAQNEATRTAQAQLASILATKIGDAMENDLVSEKLSDEQKASLRKIKLKIKATSVLEASQSSYFQTVVPLHREISNGFEYKIVMSYNVQNARKAAKKLYLSDLVSAVGEENAGKIINGITF